MAKAQTWDEVVTEMQEDFMHTFGAFDWDAYEQGERNFLETTVGFALYGPPPNLPDENAANRSGYKQNQWENIQRICNLIIQEDAHQRRNVSETWMARIFVCIPTPGHEGDRPGVATIPIFKVPKYTEKDMESVWYIDSHARIYVNWKDYLDNNLLEACRYCYPKDGIYQADAQGRVKVEFGETPAASALQTTLTALDTTSTAAGVGSTILCLASLLGAPVAAPVLAVAGVVGTAVSLYGAGRSTAALVDRGQHGQSINVDDPEARSCWLSIGVLLHGHNVHNDPASVADKLLLNIATHNVCHQP
ncbi:uncharacterized protein [Anabrus simplex]|uniref:uncharacterized protein isoform X2 n=1 Tax=Anabrus simplex TaxID=316456 RepID=UPI0035A32B75